LDLEVMVASSGFINCSNFFKAWLHQVTSPNYINILDKNIFLDRYKNIICSYQFFKIK